MPSCAAISLPCILLPDTVRIAFSVQVFSWRKFIFQFFIKLLNIVLQMNPLWNICFCRFDDIVEVDFISFPICANRFIKRDFMAAFFLARRYIRTSFSTQRMHRQPDDFPFQDRT